MGHGSGTAARAVDDVHDVAPVLEEPVARLVASRRAENLLTHERLMAIARLWQDWWPDEAQQRADRAAGRRDTSAESLREACVVTEVAAALGLSEVVAWQRVDAAVALYVDRRLPLAARLVADGALDWSRLNALVSRIRTLSAEQAQQVEERVLAPAVRALTVGRFMTEVDRAVLAVDPDAADKRAKATVDGRRVCLTKDRDGFDAAAAAASLYASGPATELTAAYAALDAEARALRAAGDPRTLDQLRHDLLVTRCTGTSTGTSTSPDASGLDAAGPDAVDSTGTRPTPDGPAPHGPAQASPMPKAQILVTISLETLLGLNDEPAHLDGFGPIPSRMARDLAENGIWRCAGVDGTHGTVLGLGRSTWTPGYVPGKALRDFTAVAAPTCTIPWCSTRSARCDLDHRTPHAAGGATCLCNTGPACRRHHREKSAGHLKVRPSTDPDHPPGTTVWTTRGGQRVVVLPHSPLPVGAYACMTDD